MKKKFIVLFTLLTLVLSLGLFTACGDKVTVDNENIAYHVVTGEYKHGTLSADKERAKAGETVNVTATANDGYFLDGVFVNGKKLDISDGKASFVMQKENVAITASFPSVVAYEPAPQSYAFKLDAYLNKKMASSFWTYTLDEDNKVLEVIAFAKDEDMTSESDSVEMYFGTNSSRYAPAEGNIGVKAFASGTTKLLTVSNGQYVEGEPSGVTARVQDWTVDGKTVIGYKTTVRVDYSALGVSSGREQITMLPRFINGSSRSSKPISVSHADAGAYQLPNTYLVLNDTNKQSKNPLFHESATFGGVAGLSASDKWTRTGDTDKTAQDRNVVLNATDGKDNNLFFRDTLGAKQFYGEATFRVTRILGSERWGKFGFMVFDGGNYKGLYYYVDAFVGGDGEVSVDNIHGTGLGYNRGMSGWGSWTDIPSTAGSFDLQTKTITLKITYTGTRLHLYCGDKLVGSIGFTGSNVCLGIKSFNYGLEVTNYYATTDPTDPKYIAHAPREVDYTNAYKIMSNKIDAIGTTATVTTRTKTFTVKNNVPTLYVSNGDPDDRPTYTLKVDGAVVTPTETFASGVGQTSDMYTLSGMENGTHTLTIEYVNCPKQLLVKLVLTKDGKETDISGSNWNTTTRTVQGLEVPTYYFLGSSVTYGAATGGKSFVEKVASTLGVTCVKEAVSGTTLAQRGGNSYVDRLANFDTAVAPEKLIVQLSTNDATQGVPLGTLSDSKEISSFDTTTTIGAMEYIIAYAKQTWNTDVMFYTNPKYNNATYIELISALYEVAEKWDIEVVDFYFFRDMAAISDSALQTKMSDAIHPNDAGYTWMANIFSAVLRADYDAKLLASLPPAD